VEATAAKAASRVPHAVEPSIPAGAAGTGAPKGGAVTDDISRNPYR
jgi:hypothetical protein